MSHLPQVHNLKSYSSIIIYYIIGLVEIKLLQNVSRRLYVGLDGSDDQIRLDCSCIVSELMSMFPDATVDTSWTLQRLQFNMTEAGMLDISAGTPG